MTDWDWIETERTRLRPFEEADAEAAFAWFSDEKESQASKGAGLFSLNGYKRTHQSWKLAWKEFKFDRFALTN